MPKSRTLREQVLQLLCQYDAGNEDVAYTTEQNFNEESGTTNEPDSKAKKLAKKIWDDHVVGDTHIAPFTPDWPMHRPPLIDRNILRLARYEIVSGMTPPIVAIDEAVEIAGIYSTEKSPSYVNGVLDAIFHDKLPPARTVEATDEKA